MNIKYEDSFYNALDSFLTEKNKWDDHTVNELGGFIELNLKFITQQTKDPTNAKNLQEKLLLLSEKITDNSNTSSANNLAFTVMGIAQGIFSEENKKYDYTSQLPKEVRQKIYTELFTLIDFEEETVLEPIDLHLVSKSEFEVTKKIKIDGLNDNKLLLSQTFNTLQGAIHFIKNNKNLHNVDLIGFEDLNDKDLEELKGCTWIQHLTIRSPDITDKGVEFLKELPLRSIQFFDCDITDEALEHLKKMPLRSVTFNICTQLTDKGLEYLKEIPLLQTVEFTLCPELTDKALEYLKEMPLLQNVDFSYCPKLTDKALEHLKGKPLQCVIFSGCELLTNKALEHLKGIPLKKVFFACCPQLTDKVFEYLEGMPLQYIHFGDCPQLTDKGVKDFRQHFISRGLEIPVIEGIFH